MRMRSENSSPTVDIYFAGREDDGKEGGAAAILDQIGHHLTDVSVTKKE
jgi:hypothetical protein